MDRTRVACHLPLPAALHTANEPAWSSFIHHGEGPLRPLQMLYPATWMSSSSGQNLGFSSGLTASRKPSWTSPWIPTGTGAGQSSVQGGGPPHLGKELRLGEGRELQGPAQGSNSGLLALAPQAGPWVALLMVVLSMGMSYGPSPAECAQGGV